MLSTDVEHKKKRERERDPIQTSRDENYKVRGERYNGWP